MSHAAKRRFTRTLAAGSIPMAVAMVAAVSWPGTATADTQPHRATVARTHPQWATAASDQGAAAGSRAITSRVYLTGEDPQALAALARSVSDPNSADYRHFLTPAQVKARFSATPDQVRAVTRWLTGAGLEITGQTADYIEATGPAASVQKAFGTPIHDFRQPDGTTRYAPVADVSVPAALAGIVGGVSGLASDTRVNRAALLRTAPGGTTSATPPCSAYWGQQATAPKQFPAGAGNAASLPVDPCPYTTSQLRTAYGVTPSGLTGRGVTIAVVDWYGSPTMEQDADTFAVKHGDKPFAPGQYKEIVTPQLWNSVQACGGTAGIQGEEALDVEMVHGLAPDAGVVYVGANSCMDNDLIAAEERIVDDHLADVVSDSWDELIHSSTQGDMDPALMAEYDRVFQKGALEGISFDFSTGDCGDEDPANRAGGAANCAPDSARKQVDWPSASAWITSVGGTTLGTSDAAGAYGFELAMGDKITTAKPGDPAWNPAEPTFYFGGGGGTSDVTPQPWYQAKAVPAALSGTLESGAKAAQPMRVIPDVAMNGSLATSVLIGLTGPNPKDGDKVEYYENGEGGTSVAAPEFSAMQALAIQKAGHALGFANPEIYAQAGTPSFRDITAKAAGRPDPVETVYEYEHADSSTNPPAHQLEGVLYEVGQDSSLVAAPGYDNATGLGSPTPAYLANAGAVKASGPPAPTVRRVAGGDRYATGVAASRKSFPAAGSAQNVVLATGDAFPDALAGTPLARVAGGPLLLTPSAGPDPRVTAEIARVLKPGGDVLVLGGEKAVPDSVIKALGLPDSQILRVGGADRYETSLLIAKMMGNPPSVVLATGLDFPDALAAGPYAADVFGGPNNPSAILLTAGRVLPPAVAQYLKTSATSVAAVGGQSSDATAGLPNVVATFRGLDRFDTARQVAAKFPAGSLAGVATGLDYADAVTGAALLANGDGPMLLADARGLPTATVQALRGIGAGFGRLGGEVDVFGGVTVISAATTARIAEIVGGTVAG